MKGEGKNQRTEENERKNYCFFGHEKKKQNDARTDAKDKHACVPVLMGHDAVQCYGRISTFQTSMSPPSSGSSPRRRRQQGPPKLHGITNRKNLT